jgi:mannose-6-phosphate isomerase-like protein (cupin superfamily)
MKLSKKSDAQVFENSAVCKAYEYPLGDNAINAAVIELGGRYPDEGYAVNTVCKEMVYVIRGSGRLTTDNEQVELAEGDMALIQPNEKYYFEGNLMMLLPCTPAWYPEQHRETV